MCCVAAQTSHASFITGDTQRHDYGRCIISSFNFMSCYFTHDRSCVRARVWPVGNVRAFDITPFPCGQVNYRAWWVRIELFRRKTACDLSLSRSLSWCLYAACQDRPPVRRAIQMVDNNGPISYNRTIVEAIRAKSGKRTPMNAQQPPIVIMIAAIQFVRCFYERHFNMNSEIFFSTKKDKKTPRSYQFILAIVQCACR